MSTQPPNDETFTQNVHYSQISARVPEKVGKGVYSTGAVVLQGSHEFILDFMQRLSQPLQLVARVIIPSTLMPGLIDALQENLNNYTSTFGPPPALPPIPPNMPIPSIDEIYDQMKVSDDLLAGSYANSVMILHSPAEFCFDFMTNAYPRSVVSCRIFISSFHVPHLLDSLRRSFAQSQRPKPE